MLKRTLASIFVFILALFVAACGPTHSYQSSPIPSELLDDPFYKDQIDQFDQNPALDRKLSDLIKDGKVSKEPNNTDPVIFNVERSDESIEVIEENFNENPDLYFEPSHDKVKVEEYFIDEDVIITQDLEEADESVSDDESLSSDSTPVSNTDENTISENNTNEGLAETASDSKSDQDLGSDSEKVEAEESAEEASPKDEETEENVLTDAVIDTSTIDTSEISASWDGRSYSSDYTNYLVEGIELYGKDLLDTSKDINNSGFCPNYNNLNVSERMSFWVMFLSTVAKHESGFDTNAKYLEPRSGQYSRGLLQIGYNSSHLKPYSCGFETPYEMNTNPRKNLHCGVKILNHWIRKDKAIRYYKADGEKWFGAARYWSVVRFEIWQQAKRNRLIEIKTNSQNLPFCDIPT